LQKTGWNRKAAARLLQVSYRTMLYKIEHYHMSASEPLSFPLREDKLVQGNPGQGQWEGKLNRP
jgi:hypothetical protein